MFPHISEDRSLLRDQLAAKPDHRENGGKKHESGLQTVGPHNGLDASLKSVYPNEQNGNPNRLPKFNAQRVE